MKLFSIILFPALLYAQVFTDSTSVILLRFNEPMSMDGLLDKSNYSITDELNHIKKIYRIGLVTQADTMFFNDTSAVVLISERLDYKTVYTIKARNVKDRAGNLIADKNWAVTIFEGLNRKISKPNPVIR